MLVLHGHIVLILLIAENVISTISHKLVGKSNLHAPALLPYSYMETDGSSSV